MSDIIYYDNGAAGLEAVINETDNEISPEGYIFIRNGRDEIKGYVNGILKPDMDDYVGQKKSDISVAAAEETEKALSAINVYVDETSKPKIEAYAAMEKEELSAHALLLTEAFDTHAQEKQNLVDNSAAEAAQSAAAASASADSAAVSAAGAGAVVSGFDGHVTEKQTAFDAHVSQKQEDFDDYVRQQTSAANSAIDEHKADLVSAFDAHAAGKQAAVDASALAAAESAQQAADSETAAASSESVCQDILERLGTVIKIKGRVDAVDNLPASGNLNGDAYLVGSEGGDNFAEYFWFSDHWEFLGTTGTKLAWGNITGDISVQTDLQAAFALKADAAAVNASLDLKADASAVESGFALKANLASPAFSGTPTAPTAAVSDNSQQVVNSAWFNQKIQVVSSLPASPNANVFYFCTNS